MREVYVQSAKNGDKEGIARAIEMLISSLPAAERLSPQSRVLIKPNLLSRNAPVKAVSTHPDVLRGVILALQKRGVGDILVADSPGGPYTAAMMRSIYEGCGFTPVSEELGVPLYTECAHQEVKADGRLLRSINLIKPVVERDFIINLPKFKTHVLTGMSGAVKNLFGCVPGLQKPELHVRFPEKPLFGRMLVDVCEAVKPDIHLVDGIIAMEGDGPSGGNPREVGLLLAGEDPYTLDGAICRYMGLSPARVPTLQDAAERGLCSETFDEALLRCDEALKAPIAGFVPPSSYEGRVDFTQKLPRPIRKPIQKIVDKASPRPVVVRASCIGCAKCAEICPKDVITIQEGGARIAPKDCIRCFCCHEMCPVKAIRVRRMPLFKL